MEMKIYSVYDRAAKAYMTPLYFLGRGVAFRSFQDEVNKSDSRFGAHPDDYTLCELGTFDDEKGTFTQHPTPEKVCMAREVLAQSMSQQLRVLPTDKERDALH